MHPETTPVKDLLYDILYQHSRALIICQTDADLKSMLNCLQKHVNHLISDEPSPLPTLKSMAKDFGLSTSVFNRRIRKIHELLLSEDYEHVPINLPSGGVQFALHGYNGFKLISIGELHRLPRLHEQVDFPHFRSVTGASSYFVSNIFHDYENGKIITRIMLNEGTYSPYWDLRRSRARELREAPINVLYGTEYDLKEYLKLGRGSDW